MNFFYKESKPKEKKNFLWFCGGGEGGRSRGKGVDGRTD